MSAPGPRVLVVGAGVAGLASALALGRRGARVELVGHGPSASAAAAGMVAAASEAVLDGVDGATAELWRRAAGLWPAFAAEHGLELQTAGALHVAEPLELEARAVRAQALGFVARRTREGLSLPEDAHLEAPQALGRLVAAAEAAGVVRREARARLVDGELFVEEGARCADVIVLATGWGSAGLAALAPELAGLAPIKGQLLRMQAPGAAGPVLRLAGAYLVPGAKGWTVGATMEPGADDLAPDAALLDGLRRAAAAARPELADARAVAAVGVRAATPDGAPLVGLSRSGRAILATGLRRNGWLLAPLVGEAVAAYALGEDPDAALGGQAHAWSPARLST